MRDAYGLASDFYEALDCPVSLGAYLRLKYGSYEDLVSLTTKPSNYCDFMSQQYKIDSQATNFIRKCNLEIAGLDPEEAAQASFFRSEKQCFKTNRRLSEFVSRSSKGFAASRSTDDQIDDTLWVFIDQVRTTIRRIIGDTAPSVFPDAGFGKGSTLSDAGTFTTVPDKIASYVSVTPHLLSNQDVMSDWLSTSWGEHHFHRYFGHKDKHDDIMRVVRGNEFFTVDKTAKTKRGCCKGPSLNAFYQLGIGRLLKRKLKRWGLDLTVAQDNHKLLARLASKRDHLATIDLESASDTISLELVRLLLPESWFDLLFSLRESTTTINGQVHHLEKFSAMGNGFTFELETLIFHAIAFVACGCDKKLLNEELSQYGDDCIVPNWASRTVVSAFKWFGFLINESKTFVSGPFRESCGGDYFNGHDVRSYFLKETPNEPQDLITILNGISRRWAVPCRSDHDICCDQSDSEVWDSNSIKSFWVSILKELPTTIRRCKGPRSLGDVCINTSNAGSWRARRDSEQKLYVSCYVPVAQMRPMDLYDDSIILASAIYGAQTEERDHVNDPEAQTWYGPGSKDPRRRFISHRVLGGKMSYRIKDVQIVG